MGSRARRTWTCHRWSSGVRPPAQCAQPAQYPIFRHSQPWQSAHQVDKSIYSPRSLRLAAHLKRLRVERNLTLQDVATKINRNHPYVIDYESGQRRLDIIQLTEVAWALGSSLTAVTEAVTRESLPNDEPAAGELSDFADPY